MKILDLSIEERPREKLAEQGARSLSNAQLLAVLLRTGIQGANAVDVARDLLHSSADSLCALSDMEPAAMCGVRGVGRDKAVAVAAAFELGRRLELERSRDKLRITAPEDAIPLLKRLYTTSTREECWCLFLKRSRRLISSVRVSEGGETLTEMNMKGILRQALDLHASAVIISHNHPSGCPAPSAADLKMTGRLKKALDTFDLSLLDHIIVSDGGCYSFAEERVLPG